MSFYIILLVSLLAGVLLRALLGTRPFAWIWLVFVPYFAMGYADSVMQTRTEGINSTSALASVTLPLCAALAATSGFALVAFVKKWRNGRT
jgi:hypothetical protein